MSRLNELVAELCPDGVEYKALNELFDIRNGYTPSKKNPAFWDDGVHPWFVMEDIRRDGTVLTESAAHITDAALKKNGLFPANSIIVATSATIGVHALVTVDFLCNQRFACMTIKQTYADKLDIRYVHQVFFALDRWCLEHVDQGNFATVNSAALRAYRIPVPPLEVQREIVGILDSFQELDDALTGEIAAREKQLDCLRAKVYADKTYPLVQLGSVGTFERGKRFTRAQMGGEGVPCIHYGDIYTQGHYIANEPFDRLTEDAPRVLRYANRGDVVVAATSENAEDVCTAVVWDCDEHAAVHDDCQILHHDQDPLYLSMFFNSEPFVRQKMRFVTESKVVRISGDEMAQIKLSMPPIETQKRIAFDMRNMLDLMGALRSEREARRKQLAYYRDKLLDLPEKVISNG